MYISYPDNITEEELNEIDTDHEEESPVIQGTFTFDSTKKDAVRFGNMDTYLHEVEYIENIYK